MYKRVEEKRAELARLCARFGVRRLELFGSGVTGEFEAGSSDLDFLVDFEPMDAAAYAAAYFGLLEALAELLEHPIDLVSSSSIANPYFLQGIASSRTVLYAA